MIYINRKGAYQSFFVGCARESGEKVTIKEHHLQSYQTSTTNKQHNNQHSADKEAAMAIAMHEVTILSRLSHPTVPHLQEVFTTTQSVYLVMEYLDAYRLWHFIDWRAETSQLSIADTRCILHSLGQALLHCHQQGVIVRDLSPMNILVKKNNQSNSNNNGNAKQQKYQQSPTDTNEPFEVKIVDFSLAVLAHQNYGMEHEQQLKPMSEHILFDWSLVPFLAPEILFQNTTSTSTNPNDKKASDLWSLGVLGFVMITGRLPFEGYEHNSTTEDHFLLDNIRNAQYVFDDAIWQEKAEEVAGAQQLISQLLQVSPAQRLTIQQVMKHPWLQNNNNKK